MRLADYAELTEGWSAAQRTALEAAWQEAARVLSARGLDNWLKGAAALARMGRGEGVVTSWLEAAPAVAREVGEDVIPELAQQCLLFASRTSAAVIELIVATAPVAARRLGDAELFLGYLQLLNVLLGQAPRGLRPMLEHLDALLGVLTLGGLRRWALWGAQAHRTDYEAQARYFALQSPQALAVLQKERKGTLFVDIQRRLGIYLRALWGRDFLLRPSAGDGDAPMRPFIAGQVLHLPDALDDEGGVTAMDRYRAAAAHAAAHIASLPRHLDGAGLGALEKACVGVFEDARAEALAIARFPRLGDLWRRLHDARPQGETAAALLARIARALLDPAYEDGHPLVAWAREHFEAMPLERPRAAHALGLELAAQLRARGAAFAPKRDRIGPDYRDDNRYLWEFDPDAADWYAPAAEAAPRQVRKYVSVMEMVNEVEVETAGDDAQEIWVCASELFDDDGTSFNAREGREPLPEPRHYDEFDYHLQLERPAWVTVLEKRPKLGDPAHVEALLAEHQDVTRQLRRLLDALQPQGVQRIRKLENGDDIDLDAAVRAAVDRRLGRQPDPRVMLRTQRKVRDIAVLVLLDLSASTQDRLPGSERTVLELTRAATALLGQAIHQVGDRFAIHGFCSDGRHNVFYERFKDFEQPWGELAKARLAGMQGRLSTRMGAAIRHAGHHLGRVAAARRLLLVVTDGEPADVDVRDPAYLRHDARRAVDTVVAQGVQPFCLTLDPRADRYVASIFGPRNYLILDRVEQLPQRLPLLYTALAR